MEQEEQEQKKKLDFSAFNLVKASKKALTTVGVIQKISAEQAKRGADALGASGKSLADLKLAIEFNADELKKIASSNEDAASLLKILEEDFDKLANIEERLEREEYVSGDEIRELNEIFERVNVSLTQMNDRGKISELKTLTHFDEMNSQMGAFIRQQRETNDTLNDQLYEDKKLRDYLEESGLGEKGMGLLEFFGVAALATPFKKMINAWAFLKTLNMAKIVGKLTDFIKPFTSTVNLMAKLVSGPLTLFASGLKGLGKLATAFSSFKILDNIVKPLSKGFSTAKKVFGSVSKVFGGLLTSLKPVMGLGGTALKFSRGIPILGQIITAFLAVFDFASGFGDAAKIADKAKEAVTLGDKIQAGISSVLSSLTLGFVSSKKFFQIMDSVKYFFTTSIPEKVVSLWEKIKGFFSFENFGLNEISLPDFSLPSFEKIISTAKEILDIILVPFQVISEQFGSLLGKGEELKKKFSEGISGGFNYLTSLFEEDEKAANVVDIQSRRASMGGTAMNELKKSEDRMMKYQESSIKKSSQPVNVTVSAPPTPMNALPNRDIESPDTKDLKLALANRAFGE